MNNDLANLVRSKTDIVDIIGERIPLVARGKNFFGVCPFHDDTNPSMSVSREKQIYRCFSCGASGNVFNFIMEYEHISFKEALLVLSNKTGIEIKGIHIDKSKSKNDKLYEIYELVMEIKYGDREGDDEEDDYDEDEEYYDEDEDDYDYEDEEEYEEVVVRRPKRTATAKKNKWT